MLFIENTIMKIFEIENEAFEIYKYNIKLKFHLYLKISLAYKKQIIGNNEAKSVKAISCATVQKCYAELYINKF